MPTPINSIFDKIADFIRTDISISLTLAYVLLISLGILFNQFYFGYFCIDILAYCDLTDFLITPVRQPSILIFFAGNLAFFYLIGLWDNWFSTKYPKLYRNFSLGVNTESKGYEIYKRLSFFVVFLFYIYSGMSSLANYQIKKLRSPDASEVQLTLKTQNEGLTTVRHTLIGKVSDFLIVKADTSRKKAIIYPMESIHEIRMIVK